MCDTCGCSEEGSGFTLINTATNGHWHIESGKTVYHGHTHEHDNSHEQGPDYTHTHEHDHEHSHDHTHHTTHTHEPEQGEGSARRVILETDVLHRNDMLAQRNRGFFEARNMKVLNLVSSPGSGKTTLLERTLHQMQKRAVYVIEGDQQTSLDANRIQAAGAPVMQVNTGNGCHLDAEMIHMAVKELNPIQDSLLLIENVGNLVCPALFDLGENLRVVILSVTEGEDKPLKYPNMFRSSHLCVLNKTDLLPYVDFHVEEFKQHALRINPDLQFIELSAKTGEGFERWMEWMEEK